MKNESELIDQMLRDGGAIVGSDSCNPAEIAVARACGLFALHGDCGLVLKPRGWVSAANEGVAARLAAAAMRGPRKSTAYDDWCVKAAMEIAGALREENQRVAYHASGQGDGWARSYGAGNFRSPDYASIIDRHYQASLDKPNHE